MHRQISPCANASKTLYLLEHDALSHNKVTYKATSIEKEKFVQQEWTRTST